MKKLKIINAANEFLSSVGAEEMTSNPSLKSKIVFLRQYLTLWDESLDGSQISDRDRRYLTSTFFFQNK